jgi:two-component system alkaline phosphatase synthesis response regulator PhoP
MIKWTHVEKVVLYMLKILIVEDEKAISNLIYINLSDEGYQCTCAFDGRQAADMIEKENFDLVLLDIMLPEIDGYELLEYIKPFGIPVIFITAKGFVDDRIKGLRLGADDYIVKPFQIGELSARVEAVLRRYGKSEKQLSFYDVEINIDSRQVKKDGQVVELTVKEFDLLVELIHNKNVALYRSQLYEKVWGEEFVGETRTLDSHIQRLRKKLGWEDRIKTVFRIGYRLEG